MTASATRASKAETAIFEGKKGKNTQDDTLNPKAIAIMSAAKGLFLEQGFGAVSMDQIARQAGVSKATVYAHFTSKEKLFTEMVFRACISHDDLAMPLIDADSDIEAVLEEVANLIVRVLLRPEALAVYRIILAEGPRFPELPKTFFGNGPLPMTRKLGEFFDEATRLGLLDVPDSRLAAEQMLWMVRGPLTVRRLFTEEVPGDFPAEEAVVKGAAQMSYRAHRPRQR
ncbi:MAG: TetR/AcrR family transcriptional regulator [Dongiaceae bacterium]